MTRSMSKQVFALSFAVNSPLYAAIQPGIATTDQTFSDQVLRLSVAGQPITVALANLRGAGFTCVEHEDRNLSNSERSVKYQRHVCGHEMPAYHDCARSVELGSFDGVLKHIRIALEHPDGTPSDGIQCGR